MRSIRRLPLLEKHHIVDPAKAPQGTGFYNPSYAYPWMYVRVSNYRGENHRNESAIMIHNQQTGAHRVIPSPERFFPKNMNLYAGLEDLRICMFKDRLWFTATCTHATKAMINELVVGYFNEDVSEIAWAAHAEIGSRPVKNICPFVHEGRLHLMDASLRKILRVDNTHEADGATLATPKEFLVSTVCNIRLGGGIPDVPYRGSTSPFHIHGTTWGFLVHDTIKVDTPALSPPSLSYYHYYGEIDMATGLVTFMSSPFFVVHWGIEYVSGISYERDIVRLFFGLEDREAVHAITTLDNLRAGKA